MTGIEPLLQTLRIRQALPYLKPGLVLVDLGCDVEMTLLKQVKAKMKKVIGVDSVVPAYKKGNLEIIQADLTKPWPIKPNTADVVTMLAVLEHLPKPQVILKEVYRILKPGGTLLITVPSQYSQWWLEKLLAPLGLVRKDMINQHKNYFKPDILTKLTQKAGFTQVRARYFEGIFNVFLHARKPSKLA